MTAPKEPRYKTIAELWKAPDRTVEDMKETHEWLNYEAGYPMNEGPQPKPSDVLKAQGAVVGTTGGIIAVAGGGSPVSAAGIGVGVVGGALGATGHILGIMGMDEMEDPDFELGQADLETRKTVNFDAADNSDVRPIGRFPHWADTESATETEAAGHPRDLFPLPDFSDHSADIDEQQNAQVDAVTEYSLNNDDAAGFDRFQTHHDDGTMDGYLDTAEGDFNFNPQTLAPINLDSALATDAYQHQNVAGADLIAGEANQGMDPYQAQRVQYEVLA